MILRVDSSSPTPAYEQIRDQVTTMVVARVLPAGTRLPSIRQLAGDLGLAINTVARAFHELEREGILETRGRHGSFVSLKRNGAASVEVERRLADAAKQFALHARHLGAEPARALASVETALSSIPSATT